MGLDQLNFSNPIWLWGLMAPPLVWVLFAFFYKRSQPFHQLDQFIDSHLLPYLLVNRTTEKHSIKKTLLLWSAVWAILTLALAGPRWTFREMETYSRDQSLVILLDLSESMNATDIKPSRLVRAKQKIEDLLNMSKGVKVGLIAFAADAHMIAPLTDDKETIRHLLPSLDTALVYVQGSRLSPALDMASTMLEVEPGSNKALLVISDGGFEDSGAISTAKKLGDKGVVIHTMGLATVEGAPMKDHDGNIIKKNGAPIISKLSKERLAEISNVARGNYLEGHYSNHAEDLILKELEKRADAQMLNGKKNQIWDERFYLLIIPVLPIILWWFRRGYVFAVFLLLFTPAFKLEADISRDYFKNTEEVGKQALDEGDYETAINAFQDPYRKGVSYYRSGNFPEAEKMFRQSVREEVATSAGYNLGNTLAQQQKFDEAIKAYEDVLKKCPDHSRAKENLELIKKLKEQQKQDSSKSDDSNPKDDQDDKDEEQNKNDPQDNKDEEQNKNDPQDNKDEEQNKNDPQDNKDEDQDKKDPQNNEKSQKDKSDGSDSDEQNSQDQEQSKENSQDQKQDEPPSQNKDEDSEDSQDSQDAQQTPENDEKEQPAQPEVGKDSDAPQQDQKDSKPVKAAKSQEDQDADAWLNQIANDPKMFLKNKFYIESQKNGTTPGVDPW